VAFHPLPLFPPSLYLYSFYPAILYEPNQPPTRSTLGSAQLSADKRREKLARFQRQHDDHLERIKRTYLLFDYGKKMADESRIKAKSKQVLAQFSESCARDYLRDLRTEAMPKRPNRKMNDRIFGGSADQQFNLFHSNEHDERDFQSIYTKAFGGPTTTTTTTTTSLVGEA